MILVLGGTTEGKLVANSLEEVKLQYIYSTKTLVHFVPSHYDSYRYGAFTEEGLMKFCTTSHIQLIINASHPFASILHKTIEAVSSKLEIPMIRFERSFSEKIHHDLVKYFKSFQDATAFLIENKINNLLALTGVQTIDHLKEYWLNHFTIFRILPRDSSLAVAKKTGFPIENLILEMPSDKKEELAFIIEKRSINCIITKESGESGFLSVKINVALEHKIPILIIEKPSIPASFIKVYSKEELMGQLHSLKKWV